ncbi:MAG: polysaccharide biosynthesis protein, partial [Clostridia bacterium]|nr:polysaccharide biosynthesis protein [Clostridia bacterium]
LPFSLPAGMVLTPALHMAFKVYDKIRTRRLSAVCGYSMAAALIATMANALLTFVIFDRLHWQFWLPYLLLQCAGAVAVRLLLSRTLFTFLREVYLGERSRTLIVGAGIAGQMVALEMTGGGSCPYFPVGAVDDDVHKIGTRISGVPVLGTTEEIAEICREQQVETILFAIPSCSEQQRGRIMKLCVATGCAVKDIPYFSQLLFEEKKLVDTARPINIEELLGRAPIELDDSELQQMIGDKVCLVTGGGGSIGSELCRQIARYRPRRLVMLDIYENNLYDIQQELRMEYGDSLCMESIVASVRDYHKMDRIFCTYRPDIVFHAAAHKHVPLMESCPEEAVKNNVFGTYHVVRAAEKFGVKRVVMISTDKAVNPTNTMGATKRLCEMILQSRVNSTTEFCAVRFGNVLGSNGSVVPLFKRQIEAGGPVTLTDKRIVRYFMTIPEAAQLVLEAGAMAQRGQIFVLDMGEPVKILTLAENLIRLSGLEPYRDIAIEEIGLRPGEKLYEELLVASGDLRKTANEKIFIEQQESIDPERVMDALVKLDKAVSGEANKAELTALLKSLVPTYRDAETVNSETVSAERAAEDCMSGIRGQ